MKILVMSDSHGRRDLVRKCIEKHSDVGIVLHLGDNVFDIEDMDHIFPDKRIVYVRGNGDYMRKEPLTACVETDGVRIFLTHGHIHGVNYSLNALINDARKNGAQIALYGHTHVPYNKYHDGLYVMNPGSLALPRDSSRAGYGLIEICPQGIMTNIVEFRQ